MIEELPSIKSVVSNKRMSIDPFANAVNLRIPYGCDLVGAAVTVDLGELAAFLTEHIPGFEATYVAPPKPIVLPTGAGAVIDAGHYRFVRGRNGEWFAHTDFSTRRDDEDMKRFLQTVTKGEFTIVSEGIGR